MSGSWIGKKTYFLPFEDMKGTQKDYEIAGTDNFQTAALLKGKDKWPNSSNV